MAFIQNLLLVLYDWCGYGLIPTKLWWNANGKLVSQSYLLTRIKSSFINISRLYNQSFKTIKPTAYYHILLEVFNIW